MCFSAQTRLVGREVAKVSQEKGECLRWSPRSRWSKVWCSVGSSEAPGGKRLGHRVSHGEILVLQRWLPCLGIF